MSIANDSTPLRFGILCDGPVLSRWQVECLRDLTGSKCAQLVLIVMRTPSPGKRPSSPFWRRVWRHDLLYRIWGRLFLPRSAVPVGIHEIADGTQTHFCRPVRHGRSGTQLSQKEIETLRAYDLDFLLRFGFGILKGAVLDLPRFGVWSFHHGDERRYRGRPAVFWELRHDEPVLSGMLQRLTERLDGGVVLMRWSSARRHSGYGRNLDDVRFLGCDAPRRVCTDILNGEASYLLDAPSDSRAPMNRTPNNLQMCLFLARLARHWLRRVARRLLLAENWNIGILDCPIADLLSNRPPVVRWIPRARRGRTRADPFGRKIHGGMSIWFEEQIGLREGYIQNIELDRHLEVVRQGVAYHPDVHVSYPFVVDYGGELHVLLEMSRKKRVSLFRLDDDGALVDETVLLEGVSLSDPTVVAYEGKWWLFGTVAGPRLYIWHAPDLFGPWTPHAANPVKVDVSSSRPGGSPFMHDGCLYRPAQDCGRDYGGRVVIHRVVSLTDTCFREVPVAYVEPDPHGPYPSGLHTLTAADDVTLLDGKRWVFSPLQPIRVLATKLGVKA